MKLKIQYEAEIPDGHSDEDIEEFVRYACGDNGQMKRSNPLDGEIIEPIFGTFEWEEV